MAILGRDQILQAQDIKTQTVPVPEWGGEVIVRALTGAERDAYESSCVEMQDGKQVPNLKNIRAKLVSLTVVDEQGKRLFTSADVEALGKKSGAVLDRLFDVARELSGLTQQAVETSRGNSGPGQSADSTTA
jgi:hypothetical protein